MSGLSNANLCTTVEILVLCQNTHPMGTGRVVEGWRVVETNYKSGMPGPNEQIRRIPFNAYGHFLPWSLGAVSIV